MNRRRPPGETCVRGATGWDVDEQELRHRCGEPEAHGRDLATQRLHRVVDGETGIDLATGGMQVEGDRRVGKIRLTNIERTLIDIAVRPVYSGGVFEVLKAYRLAKDKSRSTGWPQCFSS